MGSGFISISLGGDIQQSCLILSRMSCLRRHERVCLSFAVPAWQEASQAPLFWEAQEVQCFHEKIGPSEDRDYGNPLPAVSGESMNQS